jgi:hypothetical protein
MNKSKDTFEEAVSISHLVMEGHTVPEALTLVTMIVGIVLRTLVGPDKFRKALDAHYEVLKDTPDKSPFCVGFKSEADRPH